MKQILLCDIRTDTFAQDNGNLSAAHLHCRHNGGKIPGMLTMDEINRS
jgi:hypothetical protein